MGYRYSDLSLEQLYKLMGEFKEKALEAEQLGNISEVEINERKIQVAMSYAMNPAEFKPGEIYTLKKEPSYLFKISYMNGVFAWGNRMNLLKEEAEEAEGLPIALLGNKVKE